jgi:hypothetical protein
MPKKQRNIVLGTLIFKETKEYWCKGQKSKNDHNLEELAERELAK